MGGVAFLVENFYNRQQFPSHTIAMTTGAGASDDPVGTESWRLGTGRRSKYSNKTMPSNTNTQILIPVTCNRARAATGLALWPDHNLSGIALNLECSNDNFTSVEDVFTVTIPSVTMPGSLDDANGVRTETGAWLIRFNVRTALYWRLNIPAMGAGVRPQIPGVTLGMWYEADRPFEAPAGEDGDTLVQAVVESDAGWYGGTRPVRRRSEEVRLRMATELEYEQGRYHLQGLFGSGYPTWVVYDTAQADRATLAVRTPGSRLAFSYDGAVWWNRRQAVLSYTEHEPA